MDDIDADIFEEIDDAIMEVSDKYRDYIESVTIQYKEKKK